MSDNKQTEVIYSWSNKALPAPPNFKYQRHTYLRLVTSSMLLGFPEEVITNNDSAALVECSNDTDFHMRAAVLVKKLVTVSLKVVHSTEDNTTKMRLTLIATRLTQATDNRVIGYDDIKGLDRDSLDYMQKINDMMQSMINRHFSFGYL